MHMLRPILGLLALALVTLLPTQAQTTVTLTPSADNTLYESQTGNLSNGAGTFLFLGRTNNAGVRRALMQFDLSDIPSGSTIEDVTLTVNVSNAQGGARTTTLHRVTQAWGEGTSNAGSPGGRGAAATTNDATWLHAFFSGTNWNTPGGDFEESASASTSINNVGDVTWASTSGLIADVQRWVDDPTSNFGWIAIGDESTQRTAKRLGSKESAAQNMMPRLTIRYSGGATGTTAFAAVLDGSNEVPANASTGSGTVNATLNGNTLTVEGSFSGLTSDVNTSIGAHIHQALPGNNGGVVVPLTFTLDADNRGGTFAAGDNTFELTPEQIEGLQARAMYVNIHTVGYPAGEIRGQLLDAAATPLRAVLSGRAEVPANNSTGFGTVLVELGINQAKVVGTFSNLSTDLNTNVGAHLHLGGLGENGGVAIPLVITQEASLREGTFELANNTFDITLDQAQALANLGMYVNVHSVGFPAGEVRGQVLPMELRAFEAYANRRPAGTESGGTGGLMGITNGSNLALAGSFENAASDFSGVVHLHEGATGSTGGVAIGLNASIGSDNRSATFSTADNSVVMTPEQSAALFAGNLYWNIHTADSPAGELRGQMLISPNVAPGEALLTAPAEGAALDVSGNPNTELTVTWDAATDGNGNLVEYHWELAADEAFSTIAIRANVGTATQAVATFQALSDALDAAGVGVGSTVTLFHRVVSSDGSLWTNGPARSVVATRGVVTNNETNDVLPGSFTLLGNYPNPFNPTTTVRFDLPESAQVSIEVVDLLGRRVLTTPTENFAAGTAQSIQLDATNLPSGLYLYRVIAQGATQTYRVTGQMTLLK